MSQLTACVENFQSHWSRLQMTQSQQHWWRSLKCQHQELYKMTNLAEATVDTDTFGLSILGDGATIKMALFNVMVLNGNSYPVIFAIRDCTGYLSKARKKDALFITDVFSGLLLDFDAEKTVWA